MTRGRQFPAAGQVRVGGCEVVAKPGRPLDVQLLRRLGHPLPQPQPQPLRLRLQLRSARWTAAVSTYSTSALALAPRFSRGRARREAAVHVA